MAKAQKPNQKKMKRTIIIGFCMLVLISGCNFQETFKPKKFYAECNNPEFLGSEGVTANKDLSQVFENSEPILGSKYRYYDKYGDNALWRCWKEDEFKQDYKELLDKACKSRGYNGSSFCEQCTIKNSPMCCHGSYCVGYEEGLEMGQGNERGGGGAGTPMPIG